MASRSDTPDRPDTPRTRGDDDAPHVSPATPAEDARTVLLNEISWAAVLAGVVVALVAQLLLNMLGLGIGVATLDPGTGDNPSASALSIGAGVWWTLSGIVASLAGGYAAGRLSGRPKEATAAWHGLTAWAFTTLVIFYLLSSTVGGVLGGVYNTVSGALGGLGRTAATTVSAAAPALSQMADPMSAIETSLRDASGGNDPAALRDAAATAVRAALTGDQAQAQEARERAAQAVARAQNVPIEEAREQVAGYEQRYRQTVEEAAAAKLLSAREVLYSVNIHLLDVWHLTEDRLDAPPPAALAAGTPLNLMATGRTLERLAEQHPERVAELQGEAGRGDPAAGAGGHRRGATASARTPCCRSSRSSGTCGRAGPRRTTPSGRTSRCWPGSGRRTTRTSRPGCRRPACGGRCSRRSTGRSRPTTGPRWSTGRARTARRSTPSPACPPRPTRPRRSSTSSTRCTSRSPRTRPRRWPSCTRASRPTRCTTTGWP